MSWILKDRRSRGVERERSATEEMTTEKSSTITAEVSRFAMKLLSVSFYSIVMCKPLEFDYR
jgi:hypothetical protein